MAYEQYKGQSIGRALHFLHRYVIQSDEAIFHGHGVITLFNKDFVLSTSWEGDIPTFVFSEKYKYLESSQEEYLKTFKNQPNQSEHRKDCRCNLCWGDIYKEELTKI